MSEDDSHEPPDRPETELNIRVSQFTPEELKQNLWTIIDRCKNPDGSVPDVTFMQVSRQELRMLWAASRILDAHAIQRQADGQRPARGRRS